MVLEWVPNNLSERMAQSPFGGWDDFYERLGPPVLNALAFAHERRVIHRDLKPSNILITDGGQPKVAAFGIAKMKLKGGPSAGRVSALKMNTLRRGQF